MSTYLIQGRHGGRGNFELVTPKSHGAGCVHYWRDNDDGRLPWYGPAVSAPAAWPARR
jgi:hypothetical protein